MAQGFKLNSNHDLAIEGNDFALIADDDYLAQKIKCSLMVIYGEWWLDVELGIPYFTDIFVKGANLSLIRNIFTSAILAVKGVQSIVTLDLDTVASTRTLTVRFQVKSSSGITGGEIAL